MEGAFNRRPIWVRIVVLLAGVAMNFLLAARPVRRRVQHAHPAGRQRPLTVTEIQAGQPRRVALEVGDVIIGVDGQTFDRSADLTAYVPMRR